VCTIDDMTIITAPAVTHDLYRDVHKGIRSELFALTEEAGRVDPSSDEARRALAAHVRDVVWLLVSHAEHEDAAIQPTIETHVPSLADRIATDHVALERRLADLKDAADAAAGRADVHALYVELAAFTSAYLAHQDIEEREVMPALEAAIGPDAVVAVHQAIVSSIPPQDMARSLAIMLPAMNVDDRTELLGGMQAGAPPEVFAGVWSLAGSVLVPADVTALARRLGVTA
jgi:hypothetical protein